MLFREIDLACMALQDIHVAGRSLGVISNKTRTGCLAHLFSHPSPSSSIPRQSRRFRANSTQAIAKSISESRRIESAWTAEMGVALFALFLQLTRVGILMIWAMKWDNVITTEGTVYFNAGADATNLTTFGFRCAPWCCL